MFIPQEKAKRMNDARTIYEYMKAKNKPNRTRTEKKYPSLTQAVERKQNPYLIKQQFNEALFWFIHHKFHQPEKRHDLLFQ